MKRNLLYCLLFMLPVFLSAQIATGEKFNGNVTGTDVISNTNVDLQEWLDDGKTVIIDIFATWCQPCWDFHNTKTLENLYATYGPNGTDEIRVLGLEGDASTSSTDLVNATNNSWGDWTEGVSYAIIDDASFNAALKITAFPTVYVIRPDRTVFEAFEVKSNPLFWEAILTDVKEDKLAPIFPGSAKTFCDKENITETVEFYNMGTTEVNTAKFEFFVNGESKEILEYDNSVPVFGTATISTPKELINSSTVFELKPIEINGNAIQAADNEVVSFEAKKPELKKNSFKLVFTTDFYPGETTWKVADLFGEVFAEGSYTPGNEAEGGGGPDANKAFEYDITIDNLETDCIRISISDEYGDGLTSFNPAIHPVPGIEIYDRDGNLIKEKYATDYLFETNNAVFASADFLSSANDVNIVNAFEISPNPTSDVLNINVDLAVDSKASMSVVNMFGQNVLTFDNVQNQVDVSALPNGNYSLVVKTKEGVASQRFVKL